VTTVKGHLKTDSGVGFPASEQADAGGAGPATQPQGEFTKPVLMSAGGSPRPWAWPWIDPMLLPHGSISCVGCRVPLLAI